MPELPEVEIVRRGLTPAMLGARIVKVELRRKDIRFPFPPRFRERLTGRRIVGLNRRAKYLLFELDSGVKVTQARRHAARPPSRERRSMLRERATRPRQQSVSACRLAS